MSRRTRRVGGFSLLELVISLSVSVFVLVGVMAVTASMVRYQFEGIRKGEVTGLTLYSLSRMQKELEDATYLTAPALGPIGGNVLSGCSNWTSYTLPSGSQRLNTVPPDDQVTCFYYCQSCALVNGENRCSLLRYSNTGISLNIPTPACGATSGFETVVYQNFYHHNDITFSPPFFLRSAQGVEMRYEVGWATPTVKQPIPVAMYFNVRMITMNKSYTNTND